MKFKKDGFIDGRTKAGKKFAGCITIACIIVLALCFVFFVLLKDKI